jgi:pimeloyl-ACP methyl ester carboxylesterase
MTKKILISIILGLIISPLVHSQISHSLKIPKNYWGSNYRLTGYVKTNDSLTVKFLTTQRTTKNKFIKDKSRKNATGDKTDQWIKIMLTGKIQPKCDLFSLIVLSGQNVREYNLDNINLEISQDGEWKGIELKNSDFELNSDSIGRIANWKTFPNYSALIDKSEKYSGEQSIKLIQRDLAKYGNFKEHGNIVKINGADIYYEIYGKGEPLLLLHGNNESIGSFAYQIDEFRKHYKVISVDSRGQGNSTLDKQKMSYDLLASDMNLLLDQLNIDSVNILGWSDGGNTGLIMAMNYPNKVKSLITMGANLYPNKNAVKKSFLREYRWAVRLVKVLALFKPSKWKTKLRVAKMPLKYPQLNPSELKKIHVPVLIMAGEKDVINQGHTELISSSIKDSKLVILKGLTHYASQEDPKYFNREVYQFLMDISRNKIEESTH